VNVVDSSGWIAYFVEKPNAAHFIEPIQQTDKLVVPTIALLEVFKFLSRNLSRPAALSAVAHMRRSVVVPLDGGLAIDAASCGLQLRLPLADSIIYATARSLGATLWTLDADFEGLPGVKYFP
jgi:predicted nucleic acid-binding protein